MDEANKKYPNEGHRNRLREKFLRAGIDALNDYEIVELLLTLGTPRKDCKKMAKEAIGEFGGLKGVLDASDDELKEIHGIGPMNAFGVKLFQAISERYEREEVPGREEFNSPKAVADFLRRNIGREERENFVILYLDARNKLIVDKVSIGTLNASLVHPREIFKDAIRANAAQLIVAHNHPSGDPEPSPEDIALTRRIDEAAKIIGIELLDHVIVTSSGYTSLKELELI